MRKKKNFSIRKKLLIIFGTLITVAGVIQGSLARYTAQQALTARVNAHLIDKVNDIASFINSDIQVDFSFLSGFMHNTAMKDPSVSFTEKRESYVTISAMPTLSIFLIYAIPREIAIMPTVRLLLSGIRTGIRLR